jgi:hypothetical protein
MTPMQASDDATLKMIDIPLEHAPTPEHPIR